MTEVETKKLIEKLTEVIDLLKKESEKPEKPEVKEECCNKCPLKKLLSEKDFKMLAEECEKTGKCSKEIKECLKEPVKCVKECVCKDCPCKENKKVVVEEVFENFSEPEIDVCRRDSICPFNGLLFLLFLIIFVVSLIKIIKCYASGYSTPGCSGNICCA